MAKVVKEVKREKKVFNKANLVEAMASSANITKAEAGRQFDNVVAGFEAVVAQMKPEDKLQLVGFLTLELVHKDAREGRNPRTKEAINIPASNKLKVKSGSKLDEQVVQA